MSVRSFIKGVNQEHESKRQLAVDEEFKAKYGETIGFNYFTGTHRETCNKIGKEKTKPKKDKKNQIKKVTNSNEAKVYQKGIDKSGICNANDNDLDQGNESEKELSDVDKEFKAKYGESIGFKYFTGTHRVTCNKIGEQKKAKQKSKPKIIKSNQIKKATPSTDAELNQIVADYHLNKVKKSARQVAKDHNIDKNAVYRVWKKVGFTPKRKALTKGDIEKVKEIKRTNPNIAMSKLIEITGVNYYAVVDILSGKRQSPVKLSERVHKQREFSNQILKEFDAIFESKKYTMLEAKKAIADKHNIQLRMLTIWIKKREKLKV